MTQLALRLVPALALCLLASACATRQPGVASNAMTMPTQCMIPAADMTPPVPYEVLEARCGAEAWCAAWQFPQNHNLVYAQTFRQCVAGAMPARVIVQPGALPPAVRPAPPPVPMPMPINPPRPYRN